MPLVFISGYSGVGKSALVLKFEEQIKQQASLGKNKPCYFLKGKYDESTGADPFSAIVEAFSGFCSQVLTEPQQELERIQNAIQKEINEEGRILIEMIPHLGSVIGEHAEEKKLDQRSKEFEKNRLHYIFKKFVRGIANSL